jgi:hypothetical protein
MAFDDERFWDRFSAPKLSPIGAFVMAELFGLQYFSVKTKNR